MACTVITKTPIEPVDNQWNFLVTGDPTSAGLTAGIGSIAMRQDVLSRTVYTKTGAGDTAWTKLAPFPPAKYTKNTTSGATTAALGDLTGAAYVSAEYSAVGAANLTTRTAAQMFADHPNAVAGDSYTLEITNTSGGTTTLLAGSGVTLTGTMTMATNTTRRFNVTFTSATVCVIQSVGVGTIS